MSAAPTPPSQIETPASRALNFLRKLGAIIGISLAAVAVIAAALGQFNALGFSNLLFWAALVVLALAAWPAISELGSTASMAGRMIVKRDKNVQVMMEEARMKRDKWIGSSLLYGNAGVLIFVLSFVVATAFTHR
ncbi:MAG: hypothetical protein HY023_04585 [Chloroflexi bacterium]|nr:hypothetical protein [Chloroflexota bacterium]